MLIEEYFDRILEKAPMARLVELTFRNPAHLVNRESCTTLFNIVLQGEDRHVIKIFEMAGVQADKNNLLLPGFKNVK